MSEYRRYVALGDSFTEGVGDADASRPNGLRGWADRVAEQLDSRTTDFRYANLAVRGRLLDRIVSEQVDTAVGLAPDLVTIYAGGNDMMRPKFDVDALVSRYDDAIGALTATGATVVMFTAYDAGWSPVFGKLRGRNAVYNELVREVADRHGARIVDFWRFDEYDDLRMWDWDRLHMSPLGHRNMATRVLDALGAPHDIEPVHLDAPPQQTKSDERRENLVWAKDFLLPWIGRRVRGTSSGDGVAPKRPELAPIS
ncbi:SGNH/GDSL hydrolase family protein [Rhodococcus triatomae]|uniref:Lysophospholipase L1 n=1 Tax=Rhodococcus triatomae TaxID=300028 RepID=A0A1G8FC78_9NOCA|nr:SGNH/GDSL hydrolase family protein [Rhodococcus triatomae]QNG19446.1 SGNH/GDSL hydrolase family protein [Rhodococcus triatomae]QNG24640.1 SGNH/GDSL hydrolase family protein [Rhodococcus triatomae]SDH79740.1 Lysophospholipase L1 [Rhodococcus triatomae]